MPYDACGALSAVLPVLVPLGMLATLPHVAARRCTALCSMSGLHSIGQICKLADVTCQSRQPDSASTPVLAPQHARRPVSLSTDAALPHAGRAAAVSCQAFVRAGTLQGQPVAVELGSLPAPRCMADVQQAMLQVTKLTAASMLTHANLVATQSVHLSHARRAADTAGVGARSIRLVQEFCNAGCLQEAIDDGMFQPPVLSAPMPQVVTLLRDVARGMAHAHEHGISHGHLTGQDVLLKVRLHASLA